MTEHIIMSFFLKIPSCNHSQVFSPPHHHHHRSHQRQFQGQGKGYHSAALIAIPSPRVFMPSHWHYPKTFMNSAIPSPEQNNTTTVNSTKTNAAVSIARCSNGSSNGGSNGGGISVGQHSPADHEDLELEGDSQQKDSFSTAEMLKQLRRYGISGVLSYGLLNTAYYLTTFVFVWFYFAPAPGRMGYLAAVERFVKIMAMVWAGSQVTKLLRAGGALALAPFVDRGLSWFTDKYKFESRAKAFLAIVGCCVGLALLLFFFVTLLSA